MRGTSGWGWYSTEVLDDVKHQLVLQEPAEDHRNRDLDDLVPVQPNELQCEALSFLLH
jgi:hypothetical protein